MKKIINFFEQKLILFPLKLSIFISAILALLIFLSSNNFPSQELLIATISMLPVAILSISGLPGIQTGEPCELFYGSVFLFYFILFYLIYSLLSLLKIKQQQVIIFIMSMFLFLLGGFLIFLITYPGRVDFSQDYKTLNVDQQKINLQQQIKTSETLNIDKRKIDQKKQEEIVQKEIKYLPNLESNKQSQEQVQKQQQIEALKIKKAKEEQVLQQKIATLQALKLEKEKNAKKLSKAQSVEEEVLMLFKLKSITKKDFREDKETFKYLGDNYSKDDKAVYYHLQNEIKKIEEADSQTFKVLGDNDGYAKDANNVYYHGIKLIPVYYGKILDGEVDVISFENLGKRYGRDKNHVYFINQSVVMDADPETFEFISPYAEYARDKNNVYYHGEKIEAADAETFVVVGDAWAKDKNFIYNVNKVANVESVPDSAVGQFESLEKQQVEEFVNLKQKEVAIEKSLKYDPSKLAELGQDFFRYKDLVFYVPSNANEVKDVTRMKDDFEDPNVLALESTADSEEQGDENLVAKEDEIGQEIDESQDSNEPLVLASAKKEYEPEETIVFDLMVNGEAEMLLLTDGDQIREDLTKVAPEVLQGNKFHYQSSLEASILDSASKVLWVVGIIDNNIYKSNTVEVFVLGQ